MKESRSSILKMKEDKTMEFLALYEKEEVLWNTKCAGYKNKLERVKATDRIAETLNIPNFKTKHVLMKFKNLRNSYCQELRKIAEGEERGEEYKPKVFWFHKLNSFLRPHLSKSFTGLAPVEAPVKEEDEEEEDWAISVDDSEPQDYFSEDGHSSVSTSGNLLEPMKKRPRIEFVADHVPDTADISTPEQRPRDYYDDFGRYIASLLRSLPAKKALVLQPKIINLIANLAFSETD
ncbi:uncharacterized protein LOC128675251 [Plodia interpunctella]|uniref:uncharacterized protein LOC128675251 n=1 Tax=Plodia interpunctella TaxID=58824 RepID=UPI00236789DA|nr:uncharacterized protein LOC128675251 [Plodia interpunctella]